MPASLVERNTNDRSKAAVRNRRLLLISYHFPPVGGAGVQRPVKFAKYLGRFGWDVSVLMASNPSVPVFDESLCKDIPADVELRKARTWEPGYALKQGIAGGDSATGLGVRLKSAVKGQLKKSAGLLLQPDAQVLWTPNAYQEALRLLRQMPHDAILATAPPYSNLLLGGLLKRKTGLPLIVDYRDEWDLSSKYLENSQRDWWSTFVQKRIQRWILKRSDQILATTQASTRLLEQRAHDWGSQAEADCIYNGFDADDLQHVAADSSLQKPADCFRIVYTGTLWNLTTIAPLVSAIEELRERQPELLPKLELVVVGRKTPQQQALLDRTVACGCRTVFADYCDHDQALGWMASADALCLLLSDVPGADRVAPAKLFEYLALRKPILSITPDGETTDIVRRFYPDSRFAPADAGGIARWLEQRLEVERFAGAAQVDELFHAEINEFSRENQAKKLAALLNGLVDRREETL